MMKFQLMFTLVRIKELWENNNTKTRQKYS